MNEIKFEQEVWDLKKIIIGVVGLAAVAGGAFYAKNHFAPNTTTTPPATQQVQGTTTDNPIVSPTPQIKINLQEKVQQLRNDVTHLNVAEIASSSPQVQQILNQVKNLGDLPKSEAKNVCQKICSGL